MAKFLFTGFPPILCYLVYRFLSKHSISVSLTVLHLNHSSPPVVYLKKLFSLQLCFFSLSMNSLSSTIHHTHSYADDGTQHASSSLELYLPFKTATSLELLPVHFLAQTLTVFTWVGQTLINGSARTHFLAISLFTIPSKYEIAFNNSLQDPL